MTIQDLLDRVYALPRDKEILLEGKVKAVEFAIVPVGNGDDEVSGYIIVQAQPMLPLSGNTFDEPKDSIGE